MRILITGGSGFIGTNLMAHYIRQGVPLLNVDWNPPLDPAQAKWWHEADLMDEKGIDAAFGAFKPTHVVHLAGQSTAQVRPQSVINLWRSRLLLFERYYPRWKRTLARWLVVAGMRRQIARAQADNSLSADDRQAIIDAYRQVERLART